jgi:hypothetical protein
VIDVALKLYNLLFPLLNPVVEQVSNGGFEDDLDHWTVVSTAISTSEHHSGAKCADITSYDVGNILQVLAAPVYREFVQSFTLWTKSTYNSFRVVLTFTDETTAYQDFSDSAQTWIEWDLLPLFPTGKILKSIQVITKMDGHLYVDDVSLIGIGINLLVNIVYDEFDPRCPSLQLLLENMPEDKVWVNDSKYRVRHKCRLTLYMKPIRYKESEIATLKAAYFTVRSSIDTILADNKFTIPGIFNLVMGKGWDDKDSIRVGRGTKNMGTTLESRGGGDVAVVFRSEQTVMAVYYIGSG